MKINDSSYLIVVVMTVEERFLSEDHTGKHATQTPHVQTVVIHLQIRGDKLLHDGIKNIYFNSILCKTGKPVRVKDSPGSLPAVQVL